MSVFRVVAFAGLVLAVAGSARAQDARDRTIVPGQRAGAITADTTLADLIRIYGKANVRERQIGVGEGETEAGAVIYPETSAELMIIWAEPRRTVRVVQTYRKGSPWRTARGIGIGSTLAQVEKANGRHFTLAGFGWDYGGRTVTWRGGRLSKYLTVDFEATRKVGQREDEQVLGDKGFPSTHPVMRKKRLVVRFLLIEFAKTARN